MTVMTRTGIMMKSLRTELKKIVNIIIPRIISSISIQLKENGVLIKC